MAYGNKHSGLERYGKPVDPEDPGKFTLAPDLANPPLPPSFDERLEKIVSDPAALGYEWEYDDERGERQKLEIRQLIRDVIGRVTPTQLTTADNLNFELHDDDPKGNCYYAYNCAVAEMKEATKRLGL